MRRSHRPLENGRPIEHPVEEIPDFVSGRLVPAEAARVRSHIDRCPDCAAELVAWQQVARVTSETFGPEVLAAPANLATSVVAAVEAASNRARGRDEHPRLTLAERLRWLVAVVGAQLPLVRREIWPASGVLMGIGAVVSVLASRGDAPGAALGLFAPLAAAVGVAQIYGQENDPAFEIALATPTSPRLLLVARLVLVLAWDLALAVAASAVLAALDRPAAFLPLVSQWLGPMLLLGCLALFLSLFVHSNLAIAIAAGLWVLRAIDVTNAPQLQSLGGLSTLLEAIWQTSPLVLIAALLLLAASLAVAPHREPWASRAAI